MPLYLQMAVRMALKSVLRGSRSMASIIDGRGGESVGRIFVEARLQIFHQHVQDFWPALRLVDSTQHGRHVRLFDGLEGFDHSCQVHFLPFWSVESPKQATSGLRTCAPLMNRYTGSLTLAAPSPPYGAFSSAPLSAPSVSPPRSSCLT